jgi:hypothetical protein
MIEIGTAEYHGAVVSTTSTPRGVAYSIGALETPDCPDCTHGIGYHVSSGCTAVLDIDGADQHCLCRMSSDDIGAIIDNDLEEP